MLRKELYDPKIHIFGMYTKRTPVASFLLTVLIAWGRLQILNFETSLSMIKL